MPQSHGDPRKRGFKAGGQPGSSRDANCNTLNTAHANPPESVPLRINRKTEREFLDEFLISQNEVLENNLITKKEKTINNNALPDNFPISYLCHDFHFDLINLIFSPLYHWSRLCLLAIDIKRKTQYPNTIQSFSQV